jgi:hypothetical protein
MTRRNAHRPNRRELFRSTLRYLALGGISLTSAGLIARGVAPPAGGGCRQSPSCAGCGAIARCELPRALAAKRRIQR